MSYTDHYKLADDVISHLDVIITGIPDPFLVSRYVGFVAVASVTVYELAIKQIFIEFAEKKHKVLAEVTRRNFERINGRIKTSVLREDYISSFGKKYVEKFDKRIKTIEDQSLRNDHISVLSSYGNIITWRNQFAHEGRIPSTVTYPEITKAYQVGKLVIDCLAKTMCR